MNQYTGTEYLMIDAATQFGLDKVIFEKRIEWTKANLNNLEGLVTYAKNKPLYLKAVYAIRDTQAGTPTGHLVGLDSCASGIQIMSAIMGCKTGAMHTGLIANEMPDAYSSCTDFMKQELGYTIDVPRDDAKQALMTYFYGSEAKPKEIFEEGSAAYQAFFKAAKATAPEAYDLRNILLDAWQPMALEHSWIMPDGFNVKIKTMVKQDVVIKVPELNSSFTHIFNVNEGKEKGLALAANVVHSIDGMIVREMCRRCNYNIDSIVRASDLLASDKRPRVPDGLLNKKEFISIRLIEDLNDYSVTQMDINTLTRLENLVMDMLIQSNPFELVTVHDEFKAHANNMNVVRHYYKEILAELADSHIMESILQQIYQNPKIKLQRASEDLGDLIRNSNYGIA